MSNKSPLDAALEQAQACLKCVPVIVLGSGASVPHGLPTMAELAAHLGATISETGMSETDAKVWQAFRGALATQDLERALHTVTLNEILSCKVIKRTWQLAMERDVAVFKRLLANRSLLPLGRLFHYLFTSTHRRISVVTPNYDRLAEYAADAGGYGHFTGFSYGYLQTRQSSPRTILQQGGHESRTVDIWKVHGSLDWFADDTGVVLGAPSLIEIPSGLTPAIVTPGIEKYEKTHNEPFRTIMSGADDALAQAGSYLCIGYGFNDPHIQPKLLEKWRGRNVCMIIVTKELTESARTMLQGATHNYVAFEEAPGGTRVQTPAKPEGFVEEGSGLWKLPIFLEKVIG